MGPKFTHPQLNQLSACTILISQEGAQRNDQSRPDQHTSLLSLPSLFLYNVIQRDIVHSPLKGNIHNHCQTWTFVLKTSCNWSRSFHCHLWFAKCLLKLKWRRNVKESSTFTSLQTFCSSLHTIYPGTIVLSFPTSCWGRSTIKLRVYYCKWTNSWQKLLDSSFNTFQRTKSQKTGQKNCENFNHLRPKKSTFRREGLLRSGNLQCFTQAYWLSIPSWSCYRER